MACVYELFLPKGLWGKVRLGGMADSLVLNYACIDYANKVGLIVLSMPQYAICCTRGWVGGWRVKVCVKSK